MASIIATSYGQYLAAMKKLVPEKEKSDFIDRAPVYWAIASGEPIQCIRMNDSDFEIQLKTGKLVITDGGQNCCESRYITCDDDLPSYVGAKIVGMDVVPGPDVEIEADEDGWVSSDVHEQMFVKIETTEGTLTLTTHNEHNGYYGGFAVVARWRL